MDRLLQGVDEDTGRPFVLFGKVKVQTLPDGWQVVDERDGSARRFADRAAALEAAGLTESILTEVEAQAPEQPIVVVRSLISEIEAKALDRVASRLGLTREATIRRAVAAFLLEHDS